MTVTTRHILKIHMEKDAAMIGKDVNSHRASGNAHCGPDGRSNTDDERRCRILEVTQFSVTLCQDPKKLKINSTKTQILKNLYQHEKSTWVLPEVRRSSKALSPTVRRRTLALCTVSILRISLQVEGDRTQSEVPLHITSSIHPGLIVCLIVLNYVGCFSSHKPEPGLYKLMGNFGSLD